MSKIRVLVVDDSVVVRKIVTEALATDPGLEVVGTAPNGSIALSKIPQLNPDIITLDIEMPVMDGLATLREIRKTYPKLPVIMFSTLTERGALPTLEALGLGASDYVTKPSNTGSMAASQEQVRRDLIPRIRSLCWRVSGVPSAEIAPRAATASAPSTRDVAPAIGPRRFGSIAERNEIDIVTVAVSTGGPTALARIIPQLPKDFPVPIVIVQHMPPIFTRMFAARLDSDSAVTVEEGSQGQTLAPGHVYIAPGDFHMTVRRDAHGVHLATNQAPQENSCRPAADVLFRSVVEVFGRRTLGVVLTGMGQDGLRGSRLIKEAGGRVIAQDEASSVVWGMPGFVANAGLADRVLPLDQIAADVVRRATVGRLALSGRS